MFSNNQLNPVTLVGLLIVGATGVAGVLADITWEVLLLQTSVPFIVGVGLFLYGWFRAGGAVVSERATVLKWTVAGLLAFTLLGSWFGEISAQPDTSLPLSITASLSIGTALGAIIGVYAARSRRTNEKLAETVSELGQVNDRLVRKNEQMEQFVDVASHDLRNPMNVAQLRLELAQQESDSEHLEQAERALTRMETLVNDLVSLAKAGEQIDEVIAVDLGDISRSSWDFVETKDASLTVEPETKIHADGSRLRQLLENLFRNAIQHGGEDVAVTVGELDDGFYVADDGAGIPDDLRGRVLDDGVTTGGDGVGLGLSIVKQIAHAHGWETAVKQSAEGGARFEFTGVEFPS